MGDRALIDGLWRCASQSILIRFHDSMCSIDSNMIEAHMEFLKGEAPFVSDSILISVIPRRRFDLIVVGYSPRGSEWRATLQPTEKMGLDLKFDIENAAKSFIGKPCTQSTMAELKGLILEIFNAKSLMDGP